MKSETKQASVDSANIMKELPNGGNWLAGCDLLKSIPYGCSPWLSIGLIKESDFYAGMRS